ncbi:hypothetical protein EC973_002723 [Apophysomyces ossiformis]|uniref:NADH:flavin oxidoreductase/NADH oxidase N-terminal domain-containing protein n=1 Tax=Apophysomyces ossiformis TaxID=679940 RepID=A0A8H7EQZ0_9FUNG|nr:hypothetical protein EC973_002723 [Apophysomyces ossiformis]
MVTATPAFNKENPAATLISAPEKVRLFQSITSRSVTLHNRIVVPPMCMYSSVDGQLNDFHLVHYGSYALRGAGLIILEATAVEPQGRITPQDSGLWSESQIEPLKRVVDFIKSQGSVPGLQIAHAGRKASMAPPFVGDYLAEEKDGGWPEDVRGPSDLAFDDHYAKPKALTKAQIKDIVRKFADAAKRADQAGIEVLEIHSAHGFLSGNTNKRTDEYGGSLENRLRFPLEVAKAVREAWPENKPLWVRFSSTDYKNPDPMGHDEDGWDIYQAIEYAKELKKIGVDVIDCSSGGNLPRVKYPAVPMYQVQFADAVKREVQIQTGAVGLILDGEDAENILKEDKADYILIGRSFLSNSEWAIAAGQELGGVIRWPKQYSWAVNKARRNKDKKTDIKTLP